MAKPDVTHLASPGRPLNHWGVVAGFIHLMMALRRWRKIPQNRHPIISPFPAVRLVWCVKDCWGVMIFRFYHCVGHSLIGKHAIDRYPLSFFTTYQPPLTNKSQSWLNRPRCDTWSQAASWWARVAARRWTTCVCFVGGSISCEHCFNIFNQFHVHLQKVGTAINFKK